MIRIKAGTDPTETFEMYRGVLSFYSDYFRAALNGGFREATDPIFDLSAEKAKVFRVFKDWVCARKLPGAGETNWRDPCELWVSADGRQMPLFANTVMNILRDKFVLEWTVPTSELHFVYRNTTVKSNLRRFCIDAVARTGGASIFKSDENRRQWSEESLCDLAVASMGMRGVKQHSKIDVQKWDMCVYHLHDEGIRCTSK